MLTWNHYWRALWLATSSPDDIRVIEDRRTVRTTTSFFGDHDERGDGRGGYLGSHDEQMSIWRLVAIPMARTAERAFKPCQRARPCVSPGDLGLGVRTDWWEGRPSCLPDELSRPGGFPRERSLVADRGSAGFTWRVGGPASEDWPRITGWFAVITQAEFDEIRAAALEFYTVPPEDDAEVARLAERIQTAAAGQMSAPASSSVPSGVSPSSPVLSPGVPAPPSLRTRIEVRRQGGRRWDLSVEGTTGLADLRQEVEDRGMYTYSFVPLREEWSLTVCHTEDDITRATETITPNNRRTDWV